MTVLKYCDENPDKSSHKKAKALSELLKRPICNKTILRTEKDRSRIAIQTKDGDGQQFHLKDTDWMEWEKLLDQKMTAAFSYGNITLAFICTLAIRLSTITPPPSPCKFTKKWCRAYTRRRGWHYGRLQGKRGAKVVDSGTIEKSSKQLTKLLEPFNDDCIINFDESSVATHTLSPFSFKKKTKNMETLPRKANDLMSKAQITIVKL